MLSRSAFRRCQLLSHSWRPLSFAVLPAVLLCGCSFGPSRVEVPQLDPAEAASAAVEQFDSDKDQNISQSESAACPGLAGSFKLYDANQDSLVSKAEIESRLKAMLGTAIGRMPCMVVVYAGDSNRPIEGAKVRVVPESFLGGTIQTGEGVTNDRGIAKPVTIGAPPGLPGIEFGLYRVQIAHDSLKIPARYNEATELGFELSPLERDRDTFEYRLKLP